MKLLIALLFSVSLFSSEFTATKIIGLSSDKSFKNFTQDLDLVSPKSAIFDKDGNLYVNALEASKTVVYSSTFTKKASIAHTFSENEDARQKNTYKDFKYFPENKSWHGKPVESAIDNTKHILYVSSYRKSFDHNSEYSSSISIIDMTTNKLLYALPTKSIPKVLALSNDNKVLSVSNWGDNTITLWDVSQSPTTIKFIKHISLGSKINQSNICAENKDKDCGLCLRGSVFSLNDKFLITSGMHAGNKLFLIDKESHEVKHVSVSFSPIRHIAAAPKLKRYYFSTTGTGQVCSIDDKDLMSGNSHVKSKCKSFGSAIRTIAINEKENYGVAALNKSCEVAVFDLNTLEVKQKMLAPCYPVGIAISPNGDNFIVTAQGKSGVGGHKIGIYTKVN